MELAMMYKDEGNEWMKAKTSKNYHAARDCYTYAMTFIAKEMRDPALEEKKSRDLRDLQAILLSNRAMVSLALGNYGECIRDADVAIALCPEHIKSYYRKCKALYALRRYEESLQCCHDGLNMDAANKELLQLQHENETAIAKLKQIENQKVLAKKKLRRDRTMCFNIAKKNKVLEFSYLVLFLNDSVGIVTSSTHCSSTSSSAFAKSSARRRQRSSVLVFASSLSSIWQT